MLENFDYSTAQTGDIVVSACQELLEKDELSNCLLNL